MHGRGHSADTHRRILDAFWEIYCKKDIRDITVSEITDSAGLHRVTFYRHFKNVEEVLQEIEDSLMNVEDLRRIGEASMHENNNAGELIKFYEEYYLKNAKYFSVLMGPNGDPYFFERYVEFIAMKISRENGYFRYGDEDNPVFSEAILRFMHYAGLAVLNYWYQNQDKMQLSDMRKLLYDLHANGTMRYWVSAGAPGGA